MRRKANWAATALALGTAIVMAAAPAQAQTVSGWRINKVFARPYLLHRQAVAASGMDNAWVLGLVPNPEPTFVTQHWNGHRWVQVPLPARLVNVIGPWELFSNIYTTSRRNTWFFPVLPRHSVPTQYALHWNGTAWTISEITSSPDTVLDAAVFSTRNVWVFGEGGSSF